MLITGFAAGPPQTNCWVLATGPGEECVIVDPGIEAEAALQGVLEAHRLHPVAVLLTHGHFDHTFAVFPVCRARGIAAWIHPADRPQLSDPLPWVGIPAGTPLFGRLTFAEPDDVRELADGSVLQIAGLRIDVDHAPGHTPGSVTFRVGESLLSGDLLFAGSIGRTDLPGGDHEAMLRSLSRIVLALPDDTQVWPGHGPVTTIGVERRDNPYLSALAPR